MRIMVRRRKSEVLRQLPDRLDQNLLVPMTEMQMLYHQENADTVAKIVQRWRKTRFLSDKDQRRLTCALQNMRMSCNSTYLLDQETDHGVKADELAALFVDLFAESDAKAVVFSQWTRTHDIVIRRLEARGLPISMTEKNHCAENALAERVNGILKGEFGLGGRLKNKAQARRAVEESVRLYNERRPHLALALKTPEQVHSLAA